eukprot:Nk52_evm21s2449 gene=Nk52_evmTU21s2449
MILSAAASEEIAQMEEDAATGGGGGEEGGLEILEGIDSNALFDAIMKEEGQGGGGGGTGGKVLPISNNVNVSGAVNGTPQGGEGHTGHVKAVIGAEAVGTADNNSSDSSSSSSSSSDSDSDSDSGSSDGGGNSSSSSEENEEGEREKGEGESNTIVPLGQLWKNIVGGGASSGNNKKQTKRNNETEGGSEEKEKEEEEGEGKDDEEHDVELIADYSPEHKKYRVRWVSYTPDNDWWMSPEDLCCDYKCLLHWGSVLVRWLEDKVSVSRSSDYRIRSKYAKLRRQRNFGILCEATVVETDEEEEEEKLQAWSGNKRTRGYSLRNGSNGSGLNEGGVDGNTTVQGEMEEKRVTPRGVDENDSGVSELVDYNSEDGEYRVRWKFSGMEDSFVKAKGLKCTTKLLEHWSPILVELCQDLVSSSKKSSLKNVQTFRRKYRSIQKNRDYGIPAGESREARTNYMASSSRCKLRKRTKGRGRHDVQAIADYEPDTGEYRLRWKDGTSRDDWWVASHRVLCNYDCSIELIEFWSPILVFLCESKVNRSGRMFEKNFDLWFCEVRNERNKCLPDCFVVKDGAPESDVGEREEEKCEERRQTPPPKRKKKRITSNYKWPCELEKAKKSGSGSSLNGGTRSCGKQMPFLDHQLRGGKKLHVSSRSSPRTVEVQSAIDTIASGADQYNRVEVDMTEESFSDGVLDTFGGDDEMLDACLEDKSVSQEATTKDIDCVEHNGVPGEKGLILEQVSEAYCPSETGDEATNVATKNSTSEGKETPVDKGEGLQCSELRDENDFDSDDSRHAEQKENSVTPKKSKKDTKIPYKLRNRDLIKTPDLFKIEVSCPKKMKCKIEKGDDVKTNSSSRLTRSARKRKLFGACAGAGTKESRKQMSAKSTEDKGTTMKVDKTKSCPNRVRGTLAFSGDENAGEKNGVLIARDNSNTTTTEGVEMLEMASGQVGQVCGGTFQNSNPMPQVSQSPFSLLTNVMNNQPPIAMGQQLSAPQMFPMWPIFPQQQIQVPQPQSQVQHQPQQQQSQQQQLHQYTHQYLSQPQQLPQLNIPQNPQQQPPQIQQVEQVLLLAQQLGLLTPELVSQLRSAVCTSNNSSRGAS